MKLSNILKEDQSWFDILDQIDRQNQTLYHGTSTVLDLDVGDQILPPEHTEVVSERGRKKNLDLIFLTPDFNYARVYAGRSARALGGSPVVYEVAPVGLDAFRTEADGTTIFTAEGGYIIDAYYI